MKKGMIFFIPLIIVLGFSCQSNEYDPLINWDVVSYDRNPVWTPDGSHILFEFRREIPHMSYGSFIWTLDNLSGLWSVSVSGDSLVQLLANDNIYVNNFKFDIHSDGGKLAFTYDQYLYNVDVLPDSLDLSSLTAIAVISSSYKIAHPKWQPSGNRIIFENIPVSTEISQVYMVTDDGTELQYLFDGLTPSWHPDGQSIIAAVFNSGSGESTDIIRYYPFTETPAETLSVSPGNMNIFPSYSPDGSQIAFQSSNDDSTFISITDPAGGNPAILVSGGQPAWSPDGNTIAFTVIGEDNSKIWLIEKDGSNLRRLNTDIVILSKIK
ncbi:MAG: hypothetical protein GY863_09930 [bacterium]|nr:hypothetical protein [bacterium]